jgi:hypothetical protein
MDLRCTLSSPVLQLLCVHQANPVKIADQLGLQAGVCGVHGCVCMYGAALAAVCVLGLDHQRPGLSARFLALFSMSRPYAPLSLCENVGV